MDHYIGYIFMYYLLADLYIQYIQVWRYVVYPMWWQWSKWSEDATRRRERLLAYVFWLCIGQLKG